MRGKAWRPGAEGEDRCVWVGRCAQSVYRRRKWRAQPRLRMPISFHTLSCRRAQVPVAAQGGPGLQRMSCPVVQQGPLRASTLEQLHTPTCLTSGCLPHDTQGDRCHHAERVPQTHREGCCAGEEVPGAGSHAKTTIATAIVIVVIVITPWRAPEPSQTDSASERRVPRCCSRSRACSPVTSASALLVCNVAGVRCKESI